MSLWRLLQGWPGQGAQGRPSGSTDPEPTGELLPAGSALPDGPWAGAEWRTARRVPLEVATSLLLPSPPPTLTEHPSLAGLGDRARGQEGSKSHCSRSKSSAGREGSEPQETQRERAAAGLSGVTWQEEKAEAPKAQRVPKHAVGVGSPRGPSRTGPWSPGLARTPKHTPLRQPLLPRAPRRGLRGMREKVVSCLPSCLSPDPAGGHFSLHPRLPVMPRGRGPEKSGS